MDRDTRALLRAVRAANLPPVHTLTPAEARSRSGDRARIHNPFIEVGEVVDLKTEAGLPLRLYQPPFPADRPAPVVLYFHGGGWMLGDVDSYDTLCRQLCVHSGCAVVFVEYRRAPEHPFPGPLEDCLAALDHVRRNAAIMRVDFDRLAVAGDSAGGNLAAAACLKHRGATPVHVRYQALFYPVMDHACDTESYELFAEGHGLTRDEMRWFWSHYLGGADGGDPLASPLRVADARGMPETLLLTAEYDVLRDEGEAFARHLEEAGIVVEVKRVPGVVHGFIHHGGLIKRGAEELRAAALKIGARLRAV